MLRMNQQMKMDLLNESAYRLEAWTKTLLERIQRDIPTMGSIQEGCTPVPSGATKGSWSNAHLIEIARALRDVKKAYKDLHHYIWED